jgi:uncharacterized membrane protein YkvI
MTELFQSYLFRVILIPAGVFLAVMYGAGYASGLEITTYLSSSGPVAGLVAIAIAALIFGTVTFLVYELGRMFHAYDYQAFSRVILGDKAAPLYEIYITFGMFMMLAYTATTGGTAVANHFDLPRYIVTTVLLILVVFLTYQGRRIVEMTMVGTALLLLLCAVTVAFSALYFHGDAIAISLQDSSIAFDVMLGKVSIYTVAIMAYIPILLYTGRDLRSRKETLVAGYVTGFTYLFPALCMHLSFMSRYPEVLEQTIPNLWIASEIMPPLFSDVLAVVLFIAIIQTGVGLLQGFLERLDSWSVLHRNRSLSKKAHGGISVVALIACLLLSSMGLVTLLAKVFTFSFWLSMIAFIIPLFTVGIYKIVLPRPSPACENPA